MHRTNVGGFARTAGLWNKGEWIVYASSGNSDKYWAGSWAAQGFLYGWMDRRSNVVTVMTTRFFQEKDLEHSVVTRGAYCLSLRTLLSCSWSTWTRVSARFWHRRRIEGWRRGVLTGVTRFGVDRQWYTVTIIDVRSLTRLPNVGSNTPTTNPISN